MQFREKPREAGGPQGLAVQSLAGWTLSLELGGTYLIPS